MHDLVLTNGRIPPQSSPLAGSSSGRIAALGPATPGLLLRGRSTRNLVVSATSEDHLANQNTTSELSKNGAAFPSSSNILTKTDRDVFKKAEEIEPNSAFLLIK
jgi:hypothetical protein